MCRLIKQAVPELLVITDVAMDPYSSDGHDGLVVEGEIDNDASVDIRPAVPAPGQPAG